MLSGYCNFIKSEEDAFFERELFGHTSLLTTKNKLISNLNIYPSSEVDLPNIPSFLKVDKIKSTELSSSHFPSISNVGCIYYELAYHSDGNIFADTNRKCVCELSDGAIFDIVDCHKIIDAYEGKLTLQSGYSTLNITIAEIKDGKIHFKDQVNIIISDEEYRKTNVFIEETDIVGDSNIVRKLLVLRANAADRSTTHTLSELSNVVFGTDGDFFNLKSQYAACSYDQLQFEAVSGPWNGHDIKAGVGEVMLDLSVTGSEQSVVREAMLEAANEKYGKLRKRVKSGDLDHVMLCLPPGTKSNC